MEVAFAGAAVAGKCKRKLYFFFSVYRRVLPVCDCELRAKMRDHAADIMFLRTEMKALSRPFAITVFVALPLHEQFM